MKTLKNDRRSYAMGHLNHDQGCGAHRDKRTKRKRTRQAQKANALKEYSRDYPML